MSRSAAPADDGLDRLGLHRGEAVRFRRHEGGRWHEGRVAAVSSDGSVTLHDADGSARSLVPERLEVRRPGRRGTLEWQPVAELGWEQLSLW
jgi:hypothetical protein